MNFTCGAWLSESVQKPARWIVDYQLSPPALQRDDWLCVRVEYSALNYKDALALTGRGRILRKFPLVPGIDLAGEIIESKVAEWRPGQKVLVTGCGLGEEWNGGLAGLAWVHKTWVVGLPVGWDSRQAMKLGTAGFTAALALARMETLGQKPAMGPIVVTGATGGVGQIALQYLVRKGYEVWAVTSRLQHTKQLLKLGAARVLHAQDLLAEVSRPLKTAEYGGAIDTVGGGLLAEVVSRVVPWGSVAVIGLAGGAEFSSSVMPFILRGVSMLGVSSTHCPSHLRSSLWLSLAQQFTSEVLSQVEDDEASLTDALALAQKLIERKASGRILLRCS